MARREREEHRLESVCHGASGSFRLGNWRGDFLTTKNVAQERNEYDVKESSEKGRDDSPDDHGMPSSAPEEFDSTPEIGTGGGINLGKRNGKVRSAKQFFAQPKKGEKQSDLDRIHEIVDDLNGGEIQAPDKSDEST